MPNPLVLYSTNTEIAYRINQRYYRQEHYIWCTPFFGPEFPSPHDIVIPPTSSPSEIYHNLLEEVRRGDRHSTKISGNRVGILKGATYKKGAGTISAQDEQDIIAIVNQAQIVDFRPLLYIIPFSGVARIVKQVPVAQRAHPFSVEYIVESLPRKRFDMISLERR